VGDGTLDIAGIIKAAQEAGAQWFLVENDAPAIPSLESARRSLENLRKF
jgi:sugar phosphate isomerase/epimerase